jgi:FkbH-like protein
MIIIYIVVENRMFSDSTSHKSLTNSSKEEKYIKCVVWDLDNTLWHGTLLEDERVILRENVVSIIHTLDSRGILQSIASRNDYDTAIEKLKEFELMEYFLYPQIGWSSKASYIEKISGSINIAVNDIAFIDDQPFEREEVYCSFPDVFCIDVSETYKLLEMPEFNPRFITSDSRLRRQKYIDDMKRNREEEEFIGPKEEFLASLGMKLTIFNAAEEDLNRAEELTVRTNQLNATGYTYSYDELSNIRKSDHHVLLMAKLNDKFGSYGHIGLAMIESMPEVWTIKLLLMSCRVMSRGIGSIMLNYIMQIAKRSNVRLRAEFMPNGRNRMMEITYRFAGFEEVAKVDGLLILENSLEKVQSFPDYVEVISVEG